MPILSDATKQEHLELVRTALTIQPRASVIQIRKAIEEAKGISLNPHYILKLRNKVIEARKWRFNEAKILTRMAEYKEKADLAQSKLWKVIMSPTATDKNKIAAATSLMRIEKDLLDAEMDAGIFERKLGEIGFTHKLSEEQMAPILRAMNNYGIVLDADIVDVTPKQIDAKRRGNKQKK